MNEIKSGNSFKYACAVMSCAKLEVAQFLHIGHVYGISKEGSLEIPEMLHFQSEKVKDNGLLLRLPGFKEEGENFVFFSLITIQMCGCAATSDFKIVSKYLGSFVNICNWNAVKIPFEVIEVSQFKGSSIYIGPDIRFSVIKWCRQIIKALLTGDMQFIYTLLDTVLISCMICSDVFFVCTTFQLVKMAHCVR